MLRHIAKLVWLWPLLFDIALAQSPIPPPANLPVNTWVLRQLPSFPAAPKAPSKHVRLIYDSDRHLTYLWGGDYCLQNSLYPGRCASREYLWSYDVALNQWSMLLDEAQPVSGFPRGRCLPAGVYDPKRKVIWMTTGSERFNAYSPVLQSGGVYAFDPLQKVWSREGPAPDGESTRVTLPGSMAEYMVYDPVLDGLFVPGRSNIHFSLSNVNVSDGIQNDNWSASPFSTPSPVFGAVSFARDTRRNRAVVYDPYRGETWSYDFTTKQTLKLSTYVLPSKSVFGMVYDSANDAVVLFGGYTQLEGDPTATPLNELWVFKAENNQWSKWAVGGAIPSPRKGESLVYDTYNNALVQFGGTGGWQTSVDQYGYDGSEIFLLRLDLGQPPLVLAAPTNLRVQ